MSALLLYGAYGYTGRLIVERAAARSVPLILAGRDENKLRPLGERHGCEVRAFGLSAATESLGGVTTVLNAAGPFSKTAAPMVDACLAAGANYVDITGEIDVFTALHARGNEALAKGIVLLPGAGFDVVPSDCLAAHVHRRLPDAEWLSLVIGGLEELSRGTAKTAVESIGKGTVVRRGGEFVTLDKPPRGTVDLGNGLTPTIGMSWGDVATAYYSTGIPDIDVFFEASEQLERATGLSAPTRWFMGTALGQWLAQKAIDRMPPGPDETTRETARGKLLADAGTSGGKSASAQLETPEGYKLTAMTALEIALRIDRGEVAPGYHTPSSAFGPDFIMGFPGVSRRDL